MSAWPSLITALTLLVYQVIALNVGATSVHNARFFGKTQQLGQVIECWHYQKEYLYESDSN